MHLVMIDQVLQRCELLLSYCQCRKLCCDNKRINLLKLLIVAVLVRRIIVRLICTFLQLALFQLSVCLPHLLVPEEVVLDFLIHGQLQIAFPHLNEVV